MDKIKFFSRWILFSGIIISVIGLVHNAFAPAMYQQMMSDLNFPMVRDKALGMVYFFVLTGTANFFAGLLTIYSSFGLRKLERWAWVIALSSGLFIAFAQISAVLFAKFGNLLIYTSGVCAISNVMILFILLQSGARQSGEQN